MSISVDQLQIGEIYAWGNRRAKLISVSRNSHGFAEIVVACGRKLDENYTILSTRWNPDLIQNITHTWDDYKQVRDKQTASRARAKDISGRMRETLRELGLSGYVSSTGEVHIWGDLDKLEMMQAHLEQMVKDQQVCSTEDELSELLSR